MAIDFNKQLVFDPKIEIVGEEVPLAAMEKTGAVLQDRYDKSYEQYSLADEALKQMEASANAVDREKAKELRGIYNQEMQGILQKGDFHNMRQQTAALARNAAVNYKTIAERNQKIQAELDAIAKNPKYALDPEGARKHYLQKLTSVNINPETRTVSDFNVGAYNAAADVSIAEKALKIAPTIRTVTRGGESAKLVQQLFDGKPVWTKVSTSGKTEFLSADEIDRELSAYLKTDPEIQAYIARDVGRIGLDVNTKEGQQAYNQLLNERISSSTKALGPMYAVDIDLQGNDVGVIGGGSALGDGNTKKPTMGVVVNTVASSYGPTNTSLRSTLVDNLRGEKSNFHSVLAFLNSNINDKNLLPTQKLEYSRLKKSLKAINNLTSEEKEKLARFFDVNINALSSTDTKFTNLGDPKLIKLAAELNQNIGTAFTLDSKIEDKFNEFSKNNLAFQNVNLIVPHYSDAESINQLQTWMSKSLAANDFKPFKGKIDPEADYSFSKVSDRPIGEGTGIVIELKNNKDNSTILVEPKDERMLYALEKNFPGISSANRFKNTSDFINNEIRSIKDIYKENNPGAKDANLFPQNYPNNLKQGKISYSNGMFTLLDANGRVVQDNLGQPIVSTNYLDLIQ